MIAVRRRKTENRAGEWTRHSNVCRSPMAEAVFLDLLEKRNLLDKWRVDSAAACNFHVGSVPDARTMSTLKNNGITSYQHVSRQVTPADFCEFDFVFGMDEKNIL
ncbi:low molecular weight phosphotyrosine protein phosphatase domain-containing protein [Ditylenchus destructor]|nr:low molecular weight phosphotyrosine protein phosphatase domain-containing protein [Ditylenchus destructor]